MDKQKSNRTKKALGILLAFCFLISVTATALGASSPPSSSKATGVKTISSSQQNEPNQFVLQGVAQKYRNVSIIYSTTSLTGKPILSYTDAKGTHKNFTGDQVRTQKTEIGTMVTVTSMMTIDNGGIKLTMLVPAINLDGPSQKFKTIAILTTYGPVVSPIKRVLQSYEVIDLKGTASRVTP